MSQLRLERADVAELQRKTIEIDGKTIRRSGSKEQKARHVITAFASELELVLGQVKTDEKSNEITAIPELLKLFQIKGNIITMRLVRKKRLHKRLSNAKPIMFWRSKVIKNTCTKAKTLCIIWTVKSKRKLCGLDVLPAMRALGISNQIS